MKKKMGAFILCFALLGAGCVFAEEKTSPEVDPAATQMTAVDVYNRFFDK